MSKGEKIMNDDITEDLNEAFEKVMLTQNMQLTPRQQAWIAFQAGAEWTMRQVQLQALKIPVNQSKTG
jgi:hypothetical protein